MQRGNWDILPIFHLIQERGKVAQEEMYRTFNMGLGMILIVPRTKVEAVQNFLKEDNLQPSVVGTIVKGNGKVVYT